MRARVLLVVGIVAVPLLAYPLVSVTGGVPRFPTRGECVHAPVDGQPVDVVWGRYDDPRDATEFRAHVVGVGFLGTEALPDGCGRWKVVLEDVPSLEVGREIAREAEAVDLHPTLELASDG
jgi:hypothetical protein